jgi:hypothetical protein
MKKYFLLIGLLSIHTSFSYEVNMVIQDPAQNLSLNLEPLEYQKGKDLSDILNAKEIYTISYIDQGAAHSKAMAGKEVMAFIRKIEDKGGSVVSIHH